MRAADLLPAARARYEAHVQRWAAHRRSPAKAWDDLDARTRQSWVTDVILHHDLAEEASARGVYLEEGME